MIASAHHIANRLTHALVVSVALVACAGSPRSPETIVIASGTDLEGMQPMTTVHTLSRQVQRYLVFTPLVRLSATLTPEPWAASGWVWNGARTRATFVIDTSLRWHDGAPFTSADARFTIDLARNRESGYARRSDLSAVTAIDPPTTDSLRIDFQQPQADVPLVLAELPILPAHRLRDVAPRELRRHPFTFAPVGSGPYRVVTREAGRRWILERTAAFPSRMGGVAATRTLVIAVIDEATTKVAGLVSGALDIAGVNPATATLVQRDPTLRVLDYPTFFTNWLTFNPNCSVVQDVRVRRAIALAINRARIVSAGVGGFGVPSDAPSADLASGATPADTVRADALLDSAGWRRDADGMRLRDGRPLRIDMLTVGSGDNPVEQLLQADLRARGIDLRIATRDMGALLTAARSSSGAHCAVYSGVAGDPSRSQLTALFDPASSGGALDLGALRPANLRNAFAQLRTATDTAARARAWRDALTIIADSVPATPVFHSRGVQGLSARLQHVQIDLRGELFSAARWTLAPISAP
jgi:peptide/nickel transport system substrate-binding protein